MNIFLYIIPGGVYQSQKDNMNDKMKIIFV